jgi:hypothetical protein
MKSSLPEAARHDGKRHTPECPDGPDSMRDYIPISGTGQVMAFEKNINI